MKTIIMFAIISLFFSNELLAQDSISTKFYAKNIVGISFAGSDNNNQSFRFFELRDQICYEIKDFPIIPFFEPDIDFGLNNNKPKSFAALLFGLKNNFLERHNLIFSINMSSGIAFGLNDKDNAGIIGRIGLYIAYKNLLLRLVEMNLMSGFAFKGTASFGLSYAI